MINQRWIKKQHTKYAGLKKKANKGSTKHEYYSVLEVHYAALLAGFAGAKAKKKQSN